ncbi:hypothetical protein T12_16723 [Trichinella patagoniensis]|uniref:Uncharacterized protein n=1 Tax=Trichinella patagoniensis TaxID=990121 RepID=A0A0V1A5S8_9BILA|nr:hypothetical protein T12_5407 [Trichinella patagoniensis]KRY20168.1 hypothetical protein T12_16723 [Trichinella patagoniensis]
MKSRHGTCLPEIACKFLLSCYAIACVALVAVVVRVHYVQCMNSKTFSLERRISNEQMLLSFVYFNFIVWNSELYKKRELQGKKALILIWMKIDVELVTIKK